MKKWSTIRDEMPLFSREKLDAALADAMKARMQSEEETLRAQSREFVRQGFRVEELVSIRSGQFQQYIVGMMTSGKVSSLRLFCRRVWRSVFGYKVAGVELWRG